MFGERGGDFNWNKKEHHLNPYKNPERAGHTNARNYLGGGGVVLYSGLQERYFLPDFPVIAGKKLWKAGADC
jgi:hypothetical protein